MNAKRTLWITTSLVLATAPCLAHDTWLLPRTPRVTADKPARFDLTSGMAFPQRESPIKPERVASGGWRVGAARGGFDQSEAADSSLVVQVTPTDEGTAVVFLSLGPRDIDLEPDEVEHYLEEIGAPDALRRDWEQSGMPFHETYTKHAKTFVRVGAGGEDATCLRPVGLAIEFVPQRDPTALAVGDSLVVKAVKRGNEMESFAVGIACGATGESQMLRTNKAGFVAFSITSGGWWMVRGTELRRKSDGTFESDFSTLTFFVGDD
jgi:uncharacterized GH25 family protein